MQVLTNQEYPDGRLECRETETKNHAHGLLFLIYHDELSCALLFYQERIKNR